MPTTLLIRPTGLEVVARRRHWMEPVGIPLRQLKPSTAHAA